MTRNRPACYEALKRRSSLTVCFDPAMTSDAAPTDKFLLHVIVKPGRRGDGVEVPGTAPAVEQIVPRLGDAGEGHPRPQHPAGGAGDRDRLVGHRRPRTAAPSNATNKSTLPGQWPARRPGTPATDAARMRPTSIRPAASPTARQHAAGTVDLDHKR